MHTGTLTRDEVVLTQWLDWMGRPNPAALRWGFFNAFFQTGLSNLLDQAILQEGRVPMCTICFIGGSWLGATGLMTNNCRCRPSASRALAYRDRWAALLSMHNGLIEVYW
jgi:hypothetical protein